MRQADTKAIDSRLDELCNRREALCKEMAVGDQGDAKMQELVALTGQITYARLERDEIIRRTFYRRGR